MTPAMSRFPTIGPARRGLSALLATLYVALSLGAGLHVGDHDESGVEWLPSEYHHHLFELGEAAGDEQPEAPAVPCVACQMNRPVPRPDPPGPRVAETPTVAAATAVEILPPRTLERSPRTTRGPPSA
jgi:hypothetical protein